LLNISAATEPVMFERLADSTELLYRQVHPDLFREGRPSSSAFVPTKEDAGELSVALASKTTAEGAYVTHTTVHKRRSCGTWGVTIQECSELALPAFPSPLETPPDPAHGHVDFNGLPSRSQMEKVGGLLARKARDRGCLFSPAKTQEPTEPRDAGAAAGASD
jgi:hypothetical protein